MRTWEFILDKLSAGDHIMLLYVLESSGSSPGRQGFKMAVAGDGSFCGTIGGGIMEHKFVEKARALLQQNEKSCLLQKQYHDKEQSSNQSGMICSGSQLNVFIPLQASHKNTIENIIAATERTIRLSPAGISISSEIPHGLQYNTDEDWTYTEFINQQPVIHIIGGGHVGLALSELMSFLGFYIKVYDDRPGLNTLLQNNFANEKIVIPGYDKLGKHFSASENDFLVIMTVGYRTDKIALQQLLNIPLAYVGMLGSDHKTDTLLKEFREEGIDTELLKKIFTPVGINILSQTPKEIAVSIAAQIIYEKNKGLPSGRRRAG